MIIVTGLVVLALVLVNAFYVTAEFAAVGVPRSRIAERADGGDLRARRLLPEIADGARLDRWVAACQIGITLSSLVLGAYGQAVIGPRVAHALVLGFEARPLFAASAAAVGVLLALTVLQMVLGELVPKSLALQFPTTLALWVERPMRGSLRAFAWFITVLNGSGALVLRLLGRPASAQRHIHSAGEIEFLLAESRDDGLLQKDEHVRLRRALRLERRLVRDVMTPRADVRVVPADASLEEARRLVCESPFTRLPVVEGSLERTVGLLHARDLAMVMGDDARRRDPARRARDVARAILTVRDDEPAYRLLTRMRDARCQMGVVVDGHGRALGLVTTANVLDDLVGRAADEFKLVAPERVGDGRLRLPGRLRLDEAAPWVGTEWEGDAFTVGEHVQAVFARLPRAGERIVIDGVEVEVERVGPNAVESVLARPRPRVAAPAEARRG